MKGDQCTETEIEKKKPTTRTTTEIVKSNVIFLATFLSFVAYIIKSQYRQNFQ